MSHRIYLCWILRSQKILHLEGNYRSNRNAIKNAARKAKINNFIENNLENGYETIIGDNGVKLSGGEKQRLA